MLIIPGEHDKLYLFGPLIAYRIIDYPLPLVISGIVLVSYETYHKISKGRSIRRILSERLQQRKAEEQKTEN